MATYIANKPCRFGGESYHIGDKIPGDKILPKRIGGLLRMGVISEGGVEAVKPAPAPAPAPEPTVPPKTEAAEVKAEETKKETAKKSQK